MPVVKGGVWTNIEDEILKASVSKYGLNQWARVSSLLARKTPKQCKARWTEWLDPGIRKIEWSREEDEKLLHLAKLMPTQWRTIAPIVGRTATQCLERYQKLLDEAEARESGELSLGGPDGGETAAPSADDVRKLRPGELDPDPESKPARPDTIDLDEDEKEMLSEARARLANTQGKKAKRKARERQLEESRRLAVLQKRRELKTAGINIKVTTKKKGQMDYNADVPFEKAPAPGFYDTQEERARNEHDREMFDPRKQQLANKRKGDQQGEGGQDAKKRKSDKSSGASAFAAAAKAGQLQRIREAEQSSKRRALVLPAPQVSEAELEDIVKMGLSGDRASSMAEASENDATRGLISNYTNTVSATPIRTPMAPQEEDRIANELRNAKARTETRSVLFGGENTPLHEGGATTGYDGIKPSQQATATPNPMATPFRNGGLNDVGATPLRTGPGATPMRTPRDNFSLNQEDASMQLIGQTPRDVSMREQAAKSSLRSKLAQLPKPKETEWELELPEEQEEKSTTTTDAVLEDSAARDARNAQLAEAAAMAEFKRQSQVVQRGLPRPSFVDVDALMQKARKNKDRIQRMIAEEAVLLIAHDALKHGGATVKGDVKPLQVFSDDALKRAHEQVLKDMGPPAEQKKFAEACEKEWQKLHDATPYYLLGYDSDDEIDEEQLLIEEINRVQERNKQTAARCDALEKKLSKTLGGYINRSKKLQAKMTETSEAIEANKVKIAVARQALASEEAAIRNRTEKLREEVEFVSRREREAQEGYRRLKEELDSMDREEKMRNVSG
jgi:pre-mRNA-splicing factor CDC5/CEF1